MSAVAAPSVYAGGASVIAVGVLLAEFGMFRQALLRDQVRLYAAQSALISALAILVAAARHLPELYVLGALSAGLKVVIVPVVLRRLLRGIGRADRLRRTGPLSPERAREHGALGPIGKGSGYRDDAREIRPYDAYSSLGLQPPAIGGDGDALARLRVRFDEVTQSFRLLRQVTDELAEAPAGPLRDEGGSWDGRAVGWAEAPQGEVLYDVRVEDGRIVRCRPRSASFHNLVLMHEVFAGDILTDFPFIEASFGLSVAGVAG